MLWLIKLKITCVEHDESAGTNFSVIEETQHGHEASENAFGPQMAIGFIFSPEHVLLLTVECKLDNHIQQCRSIPIVQFECATVDYACCAPSNFRCQYNGQAFIGCISVYGSWGQGRSWKFCFCHDLRSRTNERDGDWGVINTILEVEQEHIMFSGCLDCFLVLVARLIQMLTILRQTYLISQFINTRIFSSCSTMESAALIHTTVWITTALCSALAIPLITLMATSGPPIIILIIFVIVTASRIITATTIR